MIDLTKSSLLARAGHRKLQLLRTSVFVAAILLAVDVALGWILADALPDIDVIYAHLWNTVDKLIEHLNTVIDWITNNPAGLKLNEPVNSTLSSFFRYHIYLWQTFVQFLRVPWLIEALLASSRLGVSVVAAVSVDLLQVLALHIMCFDAYAFRLWDLSWRTLSALWGLVRGKKWNPLRKRTDNISLETREQFIGTSLFTILLFLLPTFFVYFVVFRALRLAVRLVMFGFELVAMAPVHIHHFGGKLLRKIDT